MHNFTTRHLSVHHPKSPLSLFRPLPCSQGTGMVVPRWGQREMNIAGSLAILARKVCVWWVGVRGGGWRRYSILLNINNCLLGEHSLSLLKIAIFFKFGLWKEQVCYKNIIMCYNPSHQQQSMLKYEITFHFSKMIHV